MYQQLSLFFFIYKTKVRRSKRNTDKSMWDFGTPLPVTEYFDQNIIAKEHLTIWFSKI